MLVSQGNKTMLDDAYDDGDVLMKKEKKPACRPMKITSNAMNDV